MNSAAAVFAAEAASGPPLAFEALSTLSAAEARNAQTSSVRFSADPCALLSHPASISSPVAASSAAVASPREKRSVRLITPTRLLTVRRYTDSSVHTSGSSRSHDSSTISFAASSRVRRRVRREPTDRSAPRTASLFLWRRAGDAVTIGAIASATTEAALTASNSASSDDTDSTARRGAEDRASGAERPATAARGAVWTTVAAASSSMAGRVWRCCGGRCVERPLAWCGDAVAGACAASSANGVVEKEFWDLRSGRAQHCFLSLFRAQHWHEIPVWCRRAVLPPLVGMRR